MNVFRLIVDPALIGIEQKKMNYPMVNISNFLQHMLLRHPKIYVNYAHHIMHYLQEAEVCDFFVLTDCEPSN